MDDWSLSVAAAEVAVPDNDEVQVIKRDKAHWENGRLRFNPEARDVTPMQRIEVLRRDGYTCQCPGCPNHLWLETHHIVFYRHGGQTVPANLLILCGAYVTSVLCDVWEVAAAWAGFPIEEMKRKGWSWSGPSGWTAIWAGKAAS